MLWLQVIGVVIGVSGGTLGIISWFRTIKRQRPKIDVVSYDTVLIYGEDRKAEFLAFDTTVTNKSDTTNSLVEYGLIIGHPYSTSTRPIHFSENELGESVLEAADQSKKLAIHETKFDWLDTPVNLSPHTSKSGYIGFPLPSIPQDIVKSLEYAVVIIPSEGQPSLVPLILDNYEWRSVAYNDSENKKSDSID